MMRTPKLHVPGLMILVLLAALCVGSSAVPALAGDPPSTGDDATLLVKLPREHVRELVSWVSKRRGSTVDVETLTQLRPLSDARPASSNQTRDPAGAVAGAREEAVLPMLASSVDVLEAIEAAIGAVGSKAEEPASIQLVAVQVDERRARIQVRAADTGSIDELREALARNVYLRSRADGDFVMAGSIVRLADGALRTDMQIRFRSPYAGKASTPNREHEAALPLTTSHVEKAARASGATLATASAVRRDANRRGGYEKLYRDYTFDVGTLDRLGVLLANLQAGPGTITSLRYQLSEHQSGSKEGTHQINRITIRVAGVRPTVQSLSESGK